MKKPMIVSMVSILPQSVSKRMLMVLLLCSMPVSLPAWGQDFNPGEYEITVKVEMQGMAGGMPSQTMIQCLTEQAPVPNTSANAHGCKVKEMKTVGNTIKYVMDCDQQGMKSETKGQVTHKGNSFEGKSETKMGPGAGGMTIISTFKGRRIGNCE